MGHHTKILSRSVKHVFAILVPAVPKRERKVRGAIFTGHNHHPLARAPRPMQFLHQCCSGKVRLSLRLWTLNLHSTHQCALCRVMCRVCGPVDGPSSHARACCAQKVSSQTHRARGTRGSGPSTGPAHKLGNSFARLQDWGLNGIGNRNRKTTTN
jgi:hypothetical protein